MQVALGILGHRCSACASWVNLMTSHRVVSSMLLAAGVFLMAGCASQPSARQSLDDRYFQREANKLLKFSFEGQTVYCQNDSTAGSLIVHKRCISESALRQLVEDSRRMRNAVGYTQVRNKG